MGADLLGSHCRDLPQHHPWKSRSHRRSVPMGVQLLGVFHLSGFVRFQPYVRLQPVWHHLPACSPVRLEERARNQRQDIGGHDGTLEEPPEKESMNLTAASAARSIP